MKSNPIIIFWVSDPKDAADNVDWPENSAAAGMNMPAKFPGHQALVCTHTENGNNESGNIHVHIVINSSYENMRWNVVALWSVPAILKNGYKHHLTNNYSKLILKQGCEWIYAIGKVCTR